MAPAMISKTRLVPALAAVVLLLTVLATSCGNDGQSPGGDAPALVAEGWNLFMAGDYQSAAGKFNQAVVADPDYRDAFDGLGWAYARLGDLDNAKEGFLVVLRDLVKPSRDTYAGQSIVNLALKEYTEAATNSNWAIERYPSEYQFRYDPDVTSVTLRLVRATANFHLGEYNSAYADVIILNDVLDLGLPVLNPSASDFVAKLLRQIQTVRSNAGAGLI